MPPLLRNYSISGAPDAGTYRVSVKQEVNGKGSTFLDTQVKSGDLLEVSAPRGSFTLQPGDGPVVLLSAGIGATPVLAMLHALAASRSPREVWWLYGAQNAAEHPFAREVRDLVAVAPARAKLRRLQQAGCGRSARRGLRRARTPEPRRASTAGRAVARPTSISAARPAFLRSFTRDLAGWGVASGRLHREIFGPEDSVTPGISKAPARAAAPAGGRRRFRPDGLLRAQRSRCAMESGVPEPARVRRSLRRSGEVVVPDGRLPYLRVRIDRRVGAVRPGAARASGGRAMC